MIWLDVATIIRRNFARNRLSIQSSVWVALSAALVGWPVLLAGLQ
ncbi:hypothetical protein [Sphingorhabdus profundilacus]|nr:hypothetical protein [Sphingorhabdus profundilacus]